MLLDDTLSLAVLKSLVRYCFYLSIIHNVIINTIYVKSKY